MNRPDVVEFYDCDKVPPKCILQINSAIVPIEGSLINIAKVTYSVTGVDYCVDYSHSVTEAQMRANVFLSRVE